MREFQDFLHSNLGGIVTFLVAALLFIVLSGIFIKRKKLSTKIMTYAGLALAIAFTLSYIRLFSLPQGGSITPMSMLFVSVIGFWFGPAIGLSAGVAYGFLQVVQGAWVMHPVQFLLDYPLAFGMLGLSGLFWKMRGGLYIGFVVACTGRFAMSTLAGWLYWIGVDTPGALWASALYNGSYVFPEMVLTLIIIALPPVRNAINRLNPKIV
jgi:thiamine transporter